MNSAELTEQLFAARQATGRTVDLSGCALTRFDGLALQLAVADRYAAQGDPIGGWKVAYTSGGQRDRMGPGYRAFGFIPASRVLPSGSSVPLSAFTKPGIEIELCLRLDDTGAATAVAPAFELIDKRTTPTADDGTVLADGCANWGIVVGEFRPLPDVPLTSLTATLSRDGTVVDTCRPGTTMDDPLDALASLTTRLAEHHRTTHPARHIITGSITKSPVTAPGTWTGEVDSLGTVTLTCT
jgi:2-keto-4-pentenoate hydratase